MSLKPIARACLCALGIVILLSPQSGNLARGAKGIRTGSDEAARSPVRLSELPLGAVEIQDTFWAPRIEVNRTRTLDHVYRQLGATGCIHNFDIAAGKAQGKFGGPWWADSDVYKWIEGASYTLATHSDRELDAKVDQLIAKIAAAQQADGYIDTFIRIVQPDMRWRNLAFFHELFCAGSLFEAAVAHNQSTGKRSLLDVATRYADYLSSTFGPGKMAGIPGHEEVELALIKLYRLTGQRRYLELAEYFVNTRGQKPSVFEGQYRLLPERTVDLLGRDMDIRYFYRLFFQKDPAKFDTSYSQDHLPVREQREAVGHAVRAMYLYSAMADLAYETADPRLLEALVSLHDSVTHKRMYVTGGVGPSAHNEGFTEDYDLPNDSAYQETCASQGMVLWNYRMLKLTGDARYADVMELSLYNAMAAGVALTGESFCYVTPLINRGDFKRQAWFGVPCCPTTVVRFLPSLGKYIYNLSADGIWVNLYMAGKVEAPVPGGRVVLRQITNYPWEGTVKLDVGLASPAEFTIHLRMPGWCTAPTVAVNGQRLSPPISGGYAEVRRKWSDGDTIELSFPMEIQRLEAHPGVVQSQGKIAISRGPIIYCLEQIDQEGDVDQIALPLTARLESQLDSHLAGGVALIKGQGVLRATKSWEGQLYRPFVAVPAKPVSITAIPYYLWGNRGAAKMVVWVPAIP